MSTLNISNMVNSNMESNVADYEVAPMNTDGISDLKETIYTSKDWAQNWGYFNTHSDLKSAILMKAIWNVGKGYTTQDSQTKVDLDHISGWGKDTFEDVLFNMEVVRRINGDAFAEIIRDGEKVINLKPLDPSTIRIVVDGKGIIKRYEQFAKTGDSIAIKHTFKPTEIFHLSNNRLADQIHGISDISSLDKTLLAELESFDDMKKVMHRQAKPFILWKLKTDDKTKIAKFVADVEYARNLSEDLFIPDDEDIATYEIVQVNISAMVMEWRNQIRNRFYRAMGMPLVIFGNAGATESGGKIEYLAHENVFEHDQRYIENQVWQQLQYKINLIPPTSLMENLQRDQAKDGNQGLDLNPNDMMIRSTG